MTVVSTPDNMDEVTRVGDLYDFYGTLLTARQRQIVEMYHVEDWSLSEIADSLSISRQAVHDQLRRAGEQLEQYEAGLQLLTASKKQLMAWKMFQQAWMEAAPKLEPDVRQTMQHALDTLCETLTGWTGGDADA